MEDKQEIRKLNREQVIKALKCCSQYRDCDDCMSCPLYGKVCGEEPNILEREALALITEILEENEKLKELATVKEVEKEIVRKQTKVDIVKKMQRRLRENSVIRSGLSFRGVDIYTLDRVAREMVEESR